MEKKKKYLSIAALTSIISVGIHIYLSKQHYRLKFGTGEESICNINSKFNCDAVAASDYSTLFHIPMAVWGASANFILFLLLLISALEWTDSPKASTRASLIMATLVGCASLVMGTISLTLMHTLCLFCIFCYALSVITFTGAFLGTDSPKFAASDIPDFLTQKKWILIAFLAVPSLAFLAHTMIEKNFQGPELQMISEEKVATWANSPIVSFDLQKGLAKGSSDDSAFTIVEFADFRCPHCKHAIPAIKAFVAAHPDVRLVFKTFPLDGTCNPNPNFRGEGDGISCHLAFIVYCEEKLRKMGWDAHDFIYKNQEQISSMISIQQVDDFYCAQQQGDCESLKTCVNASTTMDAIKAQALEGVNAQVRGTPAIFANGKLLSWGHILPVLEKAYKHGP